MIEELKAILELLGDTTEIAGWVFGGWLTFKAVILLSTTGATVFLVSLGINKVCGYFSGRTEADLEKAKINKSPKVIDDVKIDNITIKGDAYDTIVNTLTKVRDHTSTNSRYLHHPDAMWLKKAVDEKIKREEDEKSKTI